MRTNIPRERPRSWQKQKIAKHHTLVLPFVALEWSLDWVAYFLSNWKLLEVLEYLGSLSVLVAVIFYFSESGDRTKQKHYQAWQVINTAQGKGGSGGRMEALQELNADRVPLVGVDVSGAYLQNIDLEKAKLVRANFSAADARMADFRGADFSDASLRGANFRGGNFSSANLQRVDLQDADLLGGDLSGADLSGASLTNADLRNTNLANIRWSDIVSIKAANIAGLKNAPDEFRAWALQNGAIDQGPAELVPHSK
jgi:Pentapeptide repeats (8 copies)